MRGRELEKHIQKKKKIFRVKKKQQNEQHNIPSLLQ
jgi:hypothetical protein